MGKDKKRKAEAETGATADGLDVTLNRVLGEPADPPPPAPPAPMSTRRYLEELAKLQEWVHARGPKVMVLFEGRDAACKGGAV